MARNAWNPVIAEGIGTFLFFFVGMGAASFGAFGAQPELITIALAHGLVLAVLVSAFGAVSGAHFNPAVTFGVWITGNIPARRAAAYVLAQCIGGLGAAIALSLVVGTESRLGVPALAAGIDPIEAIVIEAVLTAVLLTAVFGTAIDPRAPKVGGLFIGLAVAADVMMGGPLTGAAMNPARWLAPAAALRDLSNGHVWILGPLIGAGIMALLYRFLLLPEADLARTPGDPVPDDGFR